MTLQIRPSPSAELPLPPVRLLEARRIRLFAAIGSGAVASLLFFILYYGTLGLLPPTGVPLPDYHPLSLWQQRLDIAQFFGTFFMPPDASRLTWWIGATSLFTLLSASGVVFATICAWTLTKPTTKLGLVFGGVLFCALASAISLGSGYNPAVMRQSLPDVGTFFFGWSPWPAVQLLTCFAAYGWTLGALYRWFMRPHSS